jgi:hypothetical protein
MAKWWLSKQDTNWLALIVTRDGFRRTHGHMLQHLIYQEKMLTMFYKVVTWCLVTIGTEIKCGYEEATKKPCRFQEHHKKGVSTFVKEFAVKQSEMEHFQEYKRSQK